MRYKLADVHSYTRTCRHMDLRVPKDMLLCCSGALPSNCHPLCGSFDRTTHTLANQHKHAHKTRLLPLHTDKLASYTEYIPKRFRSLCRFCILLHTRRNTPPCFLSFPCLTIQSEAGGDFLGVVAEPIVARLLPRSIPLPHLYTLPHTPSRPAALWLLPLLINYSGFLPGHMHARAHQPSYRTYSIYTHTKGKMLMQRVLPEHEQPSPVVG